MTQAIEEVIIVVLCVLCLFLARALADAQAAGDAQRVRGEEMADWADEYQRQAEAAERQLLNVQLEHVRLQALYLQLVQTRLVQNGVMVMRNRMK